MGKKPYGRAKGNLQNKFAKFGNNFIAKRDRPVFYFRIEACPLFKAKLIGVRPVSQLGIEFWYLLITKNLFAID